MMMMIFAGSEINQDLVEVLQKKLDEVVLETESFTNSKHESRKNIRPPKTHSNIPTDQQLPDGHFLEWKKFKKSI